MIRLCWPLAALLAGCPAPAEKLAYEIVKVAKSIDCQGKAFNNGQVSELQIVASNVTIRRCKINGSIRTIGLGNNGEAKGVRKSSLATGHTLRAQTAAPRNVIIANSTITGHGRIPIYFGPGTTRTTLVDSTVNGQSDSVALYLDAESAHNVIRNNTFNVEGNFTLRQFRTREVIAVDGSAYNHIVANTINNANNGGIYLYRNCGEGGTIRHQAPQNNLIAGNTINISGISPLNHGIWLGSRNGRRLYCEEDKGFAFGSSADNGDFADHNTVRNNTFIGSGGQVKDDGKGNSID
jgi:hypothetical protein